MMRGVKSCGEMTPNLVNQGGLQSGVGIDKRPN
jgi:hypothetical protein